MTTINDIKVNIVSKIFTINNFGLLEAINQQIDTMNSGDSSIKKLPYHAGITKLRKNLTADQVFEEQGNKSITYGEIEEITKDLEWEHSLDEMLAVLD